MKKRSQSVNVKHRKISFGDFQTETIGISVKKILIEVPLFQTENKSCKLREIDVYSGYCAGNQSGIEAVFNKKEADMDSKVIKEAIDFAADPNTRAAFVSGLTIAWFLGYFAGIISLDNAFMIRIISA